MKLTHLGLVKTTLLDYPGKVASTLFTPGCNLRCPYCHNPELVENINKDSLLPLEEVLSFLKRRAKMISAVVLTGGEPLLYGDDLISLAKEIHDLGLLLKIDTNGTLPGILSRFPADFIAMDLKTSPERYKEMGYGGQGIEELLLGSLKFIKESGIPHQIRCTYTPDLISEKDVNAMVRMLKGVDQLRLTAFRPGQTLDPNYRQKKSPDLQTMEELRDLFISKGIPTIVE